MSGLNLEGVSDGVVSAAIVYQEETKLPMDKLGGILKPIDRNALKTKVSQHIKRSLLTGGRGGTFADVPGCSVALCFAEQNGPDPASPAIPRPCAPGTP